MINKTNIFIKSMKIRGFILLFMVLSISFFSCKKESGVNSKPVIKFLKINATNIQQFKDSITIDIEYTDENGDLGEDNPDKNALYVKDRRLSKADFYFVKPLSPPGSNVKIKGILSIKIKNAFLLGTANKEETTFEIKLSDRAGNWSNAIVSPEITINK